MWAWLAIPWVRKLGEIVLLLAAIGGVVHWIYHSGKEAGQQAEAGKQVEASRAQFEQIRTQFQAQLDAGRAREDQLSQMATRFADLAAQASVRVQDAQRASVADAGKVQALPDSGIKIDLEAKLGGPLESPAVLRQADTIVTDYPHKVEEVKALSGEVDATKSSLKTSQDQTANAKTERDAAITAYNGLVPLYSQAYNAAIRGHRRWYCLWLCKPKRVLELPNPATLTPLKAKL
jgi:hypothetical protein